MNRENRGDRQPVSKRNLGAAAQYWCNGAQWCRTGSSKNPSELEQRRQDSKHLSGGGGKSMQHVMQRKRSGSKSNGKGVLQLEIMRSNIQLPLVGLPRYDISNKGLVKCSVQATQVTDPKIRSAMQRALRSNRK